MRLSELRAREDHDAILAATLAHGWSRQFSRTYRLHNSRSRAGQPWLRNEVLSVYYAPGVSAPARRFIEDGALYCPGILRVPPRWALMKGWCSALGLQLTGRFAFAVTPELEHVSALVVAPGNRRVRVFDFARGVARVFLKRDFDPAGFSTEIRVRGSGAEGPFVPIRAAGEDWFEEPIRDAYALPRCPPWWDRTGLAREAADKLRAWLRRTERSVRTSDYLACLADEFHRLLEGVPLAPGTVSVLRESVGRLAALAGQRADTLLACGHGDFQPGNVLVSREARAVEIIDWEHAAERSSDYDRFTWALSARYGAGLDRRIQGYLDGRRRSIPHGVEAARTQETPMVALFLIEDLVWFLRDSRGGPFPVVAAGLAGRIRELPRILRVVAAAA